MIKSQRPAVDFSLILVVVHDMCRDYTAAYACHGGDEVQDTSLSMLGIDCRIWERRFARTTFELVGLRMHVSADNQ
jgi:hypothetical protein